MVNVYDLFLVAALAVWIVGLPAALRFAGLPMPKSLLPAWGCIPFAVLGARILNVLLYPARTGFADQILNPGFGSFTLYGGAFLAAVFVLIMCRLLHLPVWRFLDVASPVVGLSIAVSRIGCILTGCCFGLTTTLPWSIVPVYGGAAHQIQLDAGLVGRFLGLPLSPLPIHPTQVYELLAALAAAAIAVCLLLRHAPDGAPSAWFGLSLSVLRLLIFQVRAFPGASAQSLLFRGPVTFGMAILLSLLLLNHSKRKEKARQLPQANPVSEPSAGGWSQ